LGFVDELKEFCPRLIEAAGGVIIAAFCGDGIHTWAANRSVRVNETGSMPSTKARTCARV